MRLFLSAALLCGLLVSSAVCKPVATKPAETAAAEVVAPAEVAAVVAAAPAAETAAAKDLIPAASDSPLVAEATNAERIQADDNEEDAAIDNQDASGSDSDSGASGSGASETDSETEVDHADTESGAPEAGESEGSGATDADETTPLEEQESKETGSSTEEQQEGQTEDQQEGSGDSHDQDTAKGEEQETAPAQEEQEGSGSGSGDGPTAEEVAETRTLKEGAKMEKSVKSFAKDSSEIDTETKEQFDDAADERDPVKVAEEKTEKTDVTENAAKGASFLPRSRTHTHTAARKRTDFNWNGDDYHPGAMWMYPYPYYHPAYSCGQPADCGCGGWDGTEPAIESKPDEPEDAPPPPPAEKKPKAKRSHTAKHCDCRQLIPAHYYGPPSAGWGGFKPGHTGGGWGAPYWYKRSTVPIDFFAKKHKKRHHTNSKKRCQCECHCRKLACRQLIPAHYYGPPSAGWGGFKPGHTGGGWGAPFWYRHQIPMPEAPVQQVQQVYAPVAEEAPEMKQMIPSHYYGPPSAGWGGFKPGHTGAGWGAPYWYR